MVRDERNAPVLVEFDLLKKTLNLVVDNVPLYLGADHELRLNILTDQRYLHIENDPFVKRFHVKALDWTAQYGIEYNWNKLVKVTPRAGIGASADVISTELRDHLLRQFENKHIFTAGLSFVSSLDVELADYVTLRTGYRKDWYLGDVESSTFSAKLGNEFRNPVRKLGIVQYIDFSAGYEFRQLEVPGEEFRWSQWTATLGIRF